MHLRVTVVVVGCFYMPGTGCWAAALGNGYCSCCGPPSGGRRALRFERVGPTVSAEPDRIPAQPWLQNAQDRLFPMEMPGAEAGGAKWPKLAGASDCPRHPARDRRRI